MLRYDKAEFETSFGTFSQLPPSSEIEIAFAGRSNVGKSSLINKIFNRKSLARVSGVPGKTITINFYKLEDIKIVDLPGYGYAKVAKTEKERWAEMMEGYFNSERNIKLVVQLIDMRHPPSKHDIEMMEFLEHNGYNFVVAMTKSDKLKKKSQRELALKEIYESVPNYEHITFIPFSAMNGEGVDSIKNEIENAVNN